MEVWNIVFNEYFCNGSREQLDKGQATLEKLAVMGIDTGLGFERLVTTVQHKPSIFETDLFLPVIQKINEYTKSTDERAKRIVADHIRASVFMIADGAIPSNTDRGYVLRRIIRRMVRYARGLGFVDKSLTLVDFIIDLYKNPYSMLNEKREYIKNTFKEEETKFLQTLERGMHEFERGTDPFVLFTTYGFPIELTMELAKERGTMIDMEEFERKMTEHQKLSQTSSAGMFKGGLADHEPQTIKHHTAHHLLLAGLKQVLGDTVKQKGSNVTSDRLRIDFSFDRKMTDEEKKKVEDIVNQKIRESLVVERCEMPKDEAEKLGAEMEFGAKYGDVVSVYFIHEKDGKNFSKEFCGGPHVGNTSELGHFKILKEEASSQGVRRIKAVIE